MSSNPAIVASDPANVEHLQCSNIKDSDRKQVDIRVHPDHGDQRRYTENTRDVIT